MAKLLYALLASDVIIDRETGASSFIRCFEHGAVRQLPAQVPPFYVASLWELDPQRAEPFTVALQLRTPSGEKTLLGSNEVQPTGALLHKVNFRLPGLHVKEPGRHAIVVALKDGDRQVKAAELPVYVVLAPANGKAEAAKADKPA
ncbi:MAG: hypothetical protein AB7D57_08230 [Desulfovibrionaceae bacterium]